MSRLPFTAFGVLVVATVAAFFITQHLKVATPLLAGFPRPVPAGINPVSGTSCYDPAVGKTLDYRRMHISFYLLNQSDNVDVWVVNDRGQKVATLASGTYMRGGSQAARSYFSWNGFESNGALAPDGVYYVQVHLVHQDRTVKISDSSGPIPFRIITTPPKPVVTLVAPHQIHAARPAPVRVDFTGNGSRLATVLIYRLNGQGKPVLVKSFITGGRTTVWNGLIDKQPAAPGTYLIGLEVTDLACNTGRFPASLAPLPPDAATAEVTVLP
ncbi:MAG TPA: FlgD immunoglobulin-like domain containing protein [Solirubrobacteraceae bacterium]|nr:FlgD immunoglobulin-like domain containing protein [Solirubrobacteraceae bacterium]